MLALILLKAPAGASAVERKREPQRVAFARAA
jgi:hypothetical protein